MSATSWLNISKSSLFLFCSSSQPKRFAAKKGMISNILLAHSSSTTLTIHAKTLLSSNAKHKNVLPGKETNRMLLDAFVGKSLQIQLERLYSHLLWSWYYIPNNCRGNPTMPRLPWLTERILSIDNCNYPILCSGSLPNSSFHCLLLQSQDKMSSIRAKFSKFGKMQLL